MKQAGNTFISRGTDVHISSLCPLLYMPSLLPRGFLPQQSNSVSFPAKFQRKLFTSAEQMSLVRQSKYLSHQEDTLAFALSFPSIS